MEAYREVRMGMVYTPTVRSDKSRTLSIRDLRGFPEPNQHRDRETLI